jgi:hypothetical protein
MSQQANEPEPNMDATNLYREEVFTDRTVGTIRRLTPVTPDGASDPGRPVVYSGQAQVLTAAGALPLSFDIDAKSLEEAARKFAGAAREALDETMSELERMRRDAASSIIVPEAGAPAAPGGPLGPGSLPGGGGRIKFP